MSGDLSEGSRVPNAAAAMPPAAWESPGEVARIAEATPELIRRYLKAGLISCAVDASGRRSFPSGTGERVRAIKAHRMDRRPRLVADSSENCAMTERVE